MKLYLLIIVASVLTLGSVARADDLNLIDILNQASDAREVEFEGQRFVQVGEPISKYLFYHLDAPQYYGTTLSLGKTAGQLTCWEFVANTKGQNPQYRCYLNLATKDESSALTGDLAIPSAEQVWRMQTSSSSERSIGKVSLLANGSAIWLRFTDGVARAIYADMPGEYSLADVDNEISKFPDGGSGSKGRLEKEGKRYQCLILGDSAPRYLQCNFGLAFNQTASWVSHAFSGQVYEF